MVYFFSTIFHSFIYRKFHYEQGNIEEAFMNMKEAIAIAGKNNDPNTLSKAESLFTKWQKADAGIMKFFSYKKINYYVIL